MIILYGNGTVTYKGDRKRERELTILRVVLMSFTLLNVCILYGKGTVKYKRDRKGEIIILCVILVSFILRNVCIYMVNDHVCSSIWKGNTKI